MTVEEDSMHQLPWKALYTSKQDSEQTWRTVELKFFKSIHYLKATGEAQMIIEFDLVETNYADRILAEYELF